MHKLTNFSIETDTTVLLQFQNGQQSRVATAQLSEHLGGADLKRVQAALKLRRDFLKTHLPKMGLMLAAGIGLAALLIGGHKLAAQLLTPHSAPMAAPMHEDVAQMVAPASTPETPSAPKPTAKDKVATAAMPRPKLASSHHTVSASKRVAAHPTEPAKLQSGVPAAGLSVGVSTAPLTNLLGLASADSSKLPAVDAPVETSAGQLLNSVVEPSPSVSPEPESLTQ